MQETSATYKTIIAGDHWFETRVSINGNWLDENKIFSLSRSRPGMPNNLPSCGGALSGTLKLTVENPSFSIPRMAQVKVFFRAVNEIPSDDDPYILDDVINAPGMSMSGDTLNLGSSASLSNDIVVFSSSPSSTNVSEWIPAGTYFIDTRAVSQGSYKTLDLECYDAMMKAEADYPDTSHAWPYSDKNVVAEIASTIGVTVDARTNQYITAGQMINLPTDYTMRETLANIAGLYGGNFIITPENKLLFVPLFGFDAEESGYYLADENGNALLFGNEGWFIYV